MTRVTPRTLTRRELNRAILERQMLLRREPASAIEVMERLVGMQAQVPTDPYTALWSRIEGFDPGELSSDLQERRAVRVVMLMRTTIHLVSARDCLEIRPLLQPLAERQWGYSPFAKALAGLDIDEVVGAGLELLAERPQTGGAIGKRLAERWPDRDPSSLGYAMRWLVPLVQIPPRGLWGRGGQPVLETVERWLGEPLADNPSLDDLVLRYLAAFGPATARDVGVWSSLTGIREVLDRLRPRLRTFRDEAGRELFDVSDAPLPDPETPAPARLLPEYDNLLLSHDDRSRMGDPIFKGRPWWHGSVLVDGFVAGTWQPERRNGGTTLRIGLYRSLTDAELADVEAEAASLTAFLAPDGERDGRNRRPGDEDMSGPSWTVRLRRPVRREGAERYVFVTLVSFAGTVIATRWFLSLTGFPQIGGGDLHIAHALWGGAALFVAALAADPAGGAGRLHHLRRAGRHRDRPLHRRGGQIHHHRERLLLPGRRPDHLRHLPARRARLDPGAQVGRSRPAQPAVDGARALRGVGRRRSPGRRA